MDISFDQLTYLNNNLDLVTEYAQKYADLAAEGLPPTNRIMHVSISTSKYNQLVYLSTHQPTNLGYNHCIYHWQGLLKYVEDNDNAPPILK